MWRISNRCTGSSVQKNHCFPIDFVSNLTPIVKSRSTYYFCHCNLLTAFQSKNEAEELRVRKSGKSQQQQQHLQAVPTNGVSHNGAYDSVELSFMEKLATADKSHKKELEDLAMFEMLEEAACDSRSVHRSL